MSKPSPFRVHALAQAIRVALLLESTPEWAVERARFGLAP